MPPFRSVGLGDVAAGDEGIRDVVESEGGLTLARCVEDHARLFESHALCLRTFASHLRASSVIGADEPERQYAW